MLRKKEDEVFLQKDVLEFISLQQIRRKVTNLNKQFLYILEDIQDEYNIPEDRYSRCRKRVLDVGNDTIREIEEYVNNFKRDKRPKE